jgi:hypothetical protein
MNNKPISRKTNIVVQDLENEVLIYDLTINKAFCLNQTSRLVFELCDGKRTIADISDEMSKRLKTLISEDFVYLALDELKKNNLLENSDELTNHFVGMSRREVVKRVGLASMIALPVISSVIAPSAAMAQSGAALGIGAICTTSPQCQSGNCFSGSNPTPLCCSATTQFFGIPTGDFDCVPLGANCSQYCCNGGGNICGFANACPNNSACCC